MFYNINQGIQYNIDIQDINLDLRLDVGLIENGDKVKILHICNAYTLYFFFFIISLKHHFVYGN